MYSLADRRDVAQLLSLQSLMQSGANRVLVDNYRVALYIADNRRFKRQFISDFPTDVEGFEDFGCGTTSLKGWLFRYETLDKYALAGDKAAIRKALLVETDGAVAEITSDQATHIAARYPHTSLEQLERTTAAQRIRVICFNLDDYYDKDDFNRFLATKPASATEAALLSDLNAIHRHCNSLRAMFGIESPRGCGANRIAADPISISRRCALNLPTSVPSEGGGEA
jgi:hypothetical protein